MSQTVDNRVVQMEFDNKQFEAGVATSIATLEKLKTSLNFEDTGKSLEGLNKSISSIDTSNLEKSADAVSDKFSAMEIVAITAISNITNKIVNLGEQLVKSLTLDPISNGFDLYENELKSVNTIMATTGLEIGEVTEQVRRLSWYADETSYSLDDMINGVSKFTSQNIDLESSASYMQGISNMAGYAGATAEQAAHSYEGFAKAMAQGYMDRRNWSWIQTAKMETYQTKEAFAEAAVQCGTLTKVADGYYQTMTGDIYDINELYSNLKDKWLTSDVMAYTFSEFSGYSDVLKSYTTELEKITGEQMECADVMKIMSGDYSELSDTVAAVVDAKRLPTLSKIFKSMGYDVKDLSDAQEILNELLESSGKIGFEQAQMYRTFGDAVLATKTAVASGWKEIFTYIFGNADDAKTLWTEVGGTMYDVFVTDLNEIKDTMRDWYDDGGFDNILDAFINLRDSVASVVGPIKSVFDDIFPKATSDRLMEFTRNLKKFFKMMELSDAASEGLRVSLSALLKPLELVKDVISFIYKLSLSLVLTAKIIIERIFTIAYALYNLRDEIYEAFVNDFGLGPAIESLKESFAELKNQFVALASSLAESLKTFFKSEGFSSIIKTLGNVAAVAGKLILTVLAEAFKVLSKINFTTISDGFGKVASSLGKLFDKLKLADKLNTILDKFVAWFDTMIESIDKFLEKSDLGAKLSKIFMFVVDAIVEVIDFIGDLSDAKLFDGLSTIFKKVGSTITGLTNIIKTGSIDVNTAAGTFSSAASTIGSAFAGLLGSMFLKQSGTETQNSLVAQAVSFSNAMADMANSGDIVRSTKQINNFSDSLVTLSTTSKKTSVDGIVYATETIRDDMITVGDTSEAVTENMNGMFGVLGTVSEYLNVGTISFGVFIALMINFIFTVSKAATFFASIASSFSKLTTSISGFVNSLTGTVNGIKKAVSTFFKVNDTVRVINAVSKTLLSLAISVGLVAVAFKMVSEIPAETFIRSAAVIAGFAILISAIVSVMAFLAAKQVEVSAGLRIAQFDFASFSVPLLALAASMGIIAFAIGKLGKLDGDQLGRATAVMTLIFGFFAGFSVLASKINSIPLATTEFIASCTKLALAVNAMVIPVIILGVLPLEWVAQGVIALGAIMTFFTKFVVTGVVMTKVSAFAPSLITSMAKLTLAIGAMIVPVTILGLMPTITVGKALVSLKLILTFFEEFILKISYIEGISKTLRDGGFANTILKLTACIVMLTVPTVAMALIPLALIGKALIALKLIIEFFTTFVQKMSQIKNITQNTLAMMPICVKLAAAIALLALPVVAMSLIPVDMIWKGIVGLGVIMTFMLAFVTLFNKWNKKVPEGELEKFGLCMIELSAAVTLLTLPLMFLSALEWDELAKGVVGLLAIMVLLDAFIIAFSKFVTNDKVFSENIDKIGTLFIKLSGAVAIIAVVLALMNKLDTVAALGSAVALGVVLTALIFAVKVISDNEVTTKDIVGLVLLEVGLLAIAGAFKILEGLDPGAMLIQAVALGLALLAIAAAISIVGSVGAISLAGAGAILIAAGAIWVLADAFDKISNVNVTGLYELTDFFEAFVRVLADNYGNLLSLAPLFMILGSSLIILGAGLITCATAVFEFSAAIAILANAFDKISEFLLVVKSLGEVGDEARANISAFLGLAPEIAEAIGTVLTSGIKVITSAGSEILNLIKTLVLGILDIIISARFKVIEATATLVGGVIQGIAENGPMIGQAIDNISEYIIPAIGRLFVSILNTILTTIRNSWATITDYAGQMVLMFTIGMLMAVEKYGPAIKSAVDALVNKIKYYFTGKESYQQLYETGVESLMTYVEGFTSAESKVEDASDNVTEIVTTGYTTLANKSETSGEVVLTSFSTGMGNKMSLVSDKTEEITTMITDGVSGTEALKGFTDAGIDGADGLLDGFTDAIEDAAPTLGNVMNKFGGFLGGEFSSGTYESIKDACSWIFGTGTGTSKTLPISTFWTDEYKTEITNSALEDMLNSQNALKPKMNDFVSWSKEKAKEAKENNPFTALGDADGTSKTLKTFEELVAAYSFGSEEIENFMSRHEEYIEKNFDFVDAIDVANYSVSRLAVSLYEANGGILQNTYETQDELIEVLENIQTAYNDARDSLASAFYSFDPFSTDRLDTGTIADISKLTVTMQDQIEDLDFFSAVVDDFLKDSRISETMKQTIIAMGTDGMQYMRMFAEASDEEVETLMNEYEYIIEMQQQYVTDGMTSWSESMIGIGTVTADEMKIVASNIGTELAEGIDVNAGTANAKTLAMNIITSMSDALGLEDAVSKPYELGLKNVEQMGDAMVANLTIATSAGNEVATVTIQSMSQAAKQNYGLLKDGGIYTGKYLVYGLAEGSLDSEACAKLNSAIEELCNDLIIEKAETLLGVRSPSRVFKQIGKYLDEGLALGISNNSKVATDAIEGLATSTTDTFTSMLSNVYDIISGEVDFDPVIRPTLDLSDVQSKASMIGSLLNSNRLAANASLYGTNQNGANSGTTYQFTQNNYSPKALSKIDIYRQTKNQFAMMKGVANS